MTLRAMSESDITFLKIDACIYQVLKDKPKVYDKGQYLHAQTVIQHLNKTYQKVAIYDSEFTFIHANFKTKEEETIEKGEL